MLNAAVQAANKSVLAPQSFTKDGFESAFGVNHLAHFLLVLLLLQSMDKEHGRIVIVSSWSHNTADSRNNNQAVYVEEEYKILYKDTESLAKGVTYTDDGSKGGFRRYGASKLCMVLFM